MIENTLERLIESIEKYTCLPFSDSKLIPGSTIPMLLLAADLYDRFRTRCFDEAEKIAE